MTVKYQGRQITDGRSPTDASQAAMRAHNNALPHSSGAAGPMILISTEKTDVEILAPSTPLTRFQAQYAAYAAKTRANGKTPLPPARWLKWLKSFRTKGPSRKRRVTKGRRRQ